MNLTHLKNQILFNRQQLAALYLYKAELKEAKRVYDEYNLTTYEYSCHTELKIVSKWIARLVELQQALKVDVREALEVQRKVSEYNKHSKERAQSINALTQKMGL